MYKKDREILIEGLNPKYHRYLIDIIKKSSNSTTQGKKVIGDGATYDFVYILLRRAMNKLNEKYIEGGVEYIDKFYPELSRKIDIAQNNIDRAAKQGREEKTDLEDSNKELKKWLELNLKGIEIYSNHKDKQYICKNLKYKRKIEQKLLLLLFHCHILPI